MMSGMNRKLLTVNHVAVTVFLSLIVFSAECLAGGSSQDVTEWVYGYVRDENGAIVRDVDVSIFDGFSTHTTKTDTNGLYKISEVPVSMDLNAVIFFTKDGYIPRALNIKVSGAKGIDYSVILNTTGAGNNGFIIGAVYQPIRGGKIKFRSGIYGFGKKKGVRLENSGEIIEKETDRDGHFLFEVPAGGYRLSGEGIREKVEVEVPEGKTVIRNLRSGFVLVD